MKELKYKDGDDSLELVLNTHTSISSTLNQNAHSPDWLNYSYVEKYCKNTWPFVSPPNYAYDPSSLLGTLKREDSTSIWDAVNR